MTRPQHLFVSEIDGALYDTRRADWTHNPLRPVFERTHRTISNLAELKATLRAGPYAWPGGYPMYLIAADGAPLSFDTVRKEWRSVVAAFEDRKRHGRNAYDREWAIVGCDINYEDEELYDAHTNERIPSAYGED